MDPPDIRCPICGAEAELEDEETGLYCCTRTGRYFFPEEPGWDYAKEIK